MKSKRFAFLDRFRFVVKTKRALRKEIEAEIRGRMSEDWRRCRDEAVEAERAKVAPNLRLAEYNAGYLAAIRDCLEIEHEQPGFHAFIIAGKAPYPDPHHGGRLKLHECPGPQ